jgi:hypothetical protein
MATPAKRAGLKCSGKIGLWGREFASFHLENVIEIRNDNAEQAFGTAHYWGRELSRFRHDVRLMPPVYVKAFVSGRKMMLPMLSLPKLQGGRPCEL